MVSSPVKGIAFSHCKLQRAKVAALIATSRMGAVVASSQLKVASGGASQVAWTLLAPSNSRSTRECGIGVGGTRVGIRVGVGAGDGGVGRKTQAIRPSKRMQNMGSIFSFIR